MADEKDEKQLTVKASVDWILDSGFSGFWSLATAIINQSPESSIEYRVSSIKYQVVKVSSIKLSKYPASSNKKRHPVIRMPLQFLFRLTN